MPRFYLHLCDETGFCEDEEGIEVTYLPAASATAVKAIRDILAGAIRRGELNKATYIEVENEQRELVMLVLVEDAVRMTSEAPRERPSFSMAYA